VILGTFAGSLSLVNELFMSYKELTWAYNIGKFQFDFKKLLKSEKKFTSALYATARKFFRRRISPKIRIFKEKAISSE